MVYISTFHIPSSYGASCTFCVIVMLFYFLHKVSTSTRIVYYLFPHSRLPHHSKPHGCYITVVTEYLVRLPSNVTVFIADQHSVKKWATCFGPGRPSSGFIYIYIYIYIYSKENSLLLVIFINRTGCPSLKYFSSYGRIRWLFGTRWLLQI